MIGGAFGQAMRRDDHDFAFVTSHSWRVESTCSVHFDDIPSFHRRM